MAPKDKTTDMRRKEAKALKKAYDEAAVDFGKELTKQIKKANLTGASDFRKQFLDQAQAANELIQRNQRKLQKAGLGDLTKEYTNALQGVQSGMLSQDEFKAISDKFEQEMKKKAPKVAEDLGSSIQGTLGNLQLDAARKNIEDSVESGINGALDFIPSNSFTKAIGIDDGISTIGKMFAEKIAPMASSVGKFIADNWKVALGAGLAIFVAGALIKGIADATDRIGESFGAMGVTEFKSDLLGAEASAVRLGYGFEDVASSTNELANNFGVGVGDAIEMSKATMDTAKALGISTQQSSQLTGMLMTMAGHSSESAQNFLKQTKALAMSAGVAPAGVMEDIASSSEEVATYTKGSGENIAKAAVKAKQMGMTLGDVAKIADGLLDFGSSLEAEMNASIMIGRKLNLQKARELALVGDLAGLQSEILEQVGSEAEWNSMNALQRKAMADAIGVGTAEMSKMVSEAGKTTKELARMRELDISEIASKEAISNITLLTNQVKAFGIQILSGIAWLSSFGGLLDNASSGWQMFGAALAIGASVIASVWIFGKLAALGMTAFAGSLGPLTAGLTALGTIGSIGIPVLVAIGLVGLTIVGILKMLPPIIDSLAGGFALIGNTITNSLLLLAEPGIILGIMGLAAGFWMLASALSTLAIAGMAAMPTLAVIGGVAAIAGAAGLGAFIGGSESNKEELDTLKKIEEGINFLVTGFGGKVTKDGKYIEDFAGKIPKKAELGTSLI